MIRAIFCVFIAVFAGVNAAPAEKRVCEQIIQTNGGELYCQKFGGGSPLIVIHGGAGFMTHDYFLPYMVRLTKNHQLILYDQRGMGKSSALIDPEHINLQTYVADIETIRLSLGVQKVSLLGHSWGGFLAMHYAILHPEAIDQLILVGAMPATSDELGLFFAEVSKRLAPHHEELEKIESSPLYLAGDPQTVEKQQKLDFQTYLYCPEKIDQINLWKSQQANLHGFKIWEIFKESVFMQPYDLTESLTRLQCPTLIIHGVADPMPMVTAERLKALIPSAQLVKIEQSGHFPFVERPDEFFRAIENFSGSNR